MPVTSFALLVCSVIAAAIFALWAATNWGVLTVLAGLGLLVIFGRWAMAPVPFDDGRT